MFCDLVGSTSLAARLDAEDWRNLVNAYLDEASKAVTALEGHVLKKLGDGLMALFGYPRAQENDAERAVRAALAIQRALEALNARNAERGTPALTARIGLDSGPVVVDSSGEVFGEAPNIAARVQGLAEPGSVLVTATVQRRTAGLFVAEDRGPHELKGAPAPVTLYRIVRASGGGRRGGARAQTPLVGREEELEIRRRRWERARSGEGQLALIVGEPGIGKSRLIEEFRARLGDRLRLRTCALELIRIVREHDLRMFRAYGEFLEGWVTAEAGAHTNGLEGMRRGAESLREQNVLAFDALIKIALCEAEARAGDLERAMATLDEALTTVERAEYRAFEAELHRTRGEMLWKRDPANPAPAEEALLTAIAVAKQQGTRSFKLRAGLSLAKLYQPTGRPVDAHAVLAPALEGFLQDAGDRRGADAARGAGGERARRGGAAQARDALEAPCGLRGRHDDDQGFRRGRDQGGAG
jgi:class 3 adenylate cyclase